MKKPFAIVIGMSLALAAAAQRQTPPPVTSAPPPLNPNVAPAAPQPGAATGATGGNAFPSTGSIVGGTGGVATSTPFPVVMPPGSHPVYPELLTPQDLVDFYRMIETTPNPELSPARGRPAGLGVTITGGGANEPSGTGVTITGGSASLSSPPPAQSPAITNVPNATNTNAPANSPRPGAPNIVPQYQ